MTIKQPKINILVPWTPQDGIRDYWMKIHKKLRKYANLNIVKNYNPLTLNPFYFIKLAFKSRKCDVLHIQHNYCLFGSLCSAINSIYALPFYLLVKFLKGPKIVTTLHDIVEPRKLNFIKRFYLDIMNFPVKYFSDKIIIHKENTKNQLIRQGYSSDSIEKINFGVEELKNIRTSKAARKHFGYPEKKSVMLFGWIRPEKKYELLINVMPHLPEMQLLLFGRAPYKDYNEMLRRKIKEYKIEDRVFFKEGFTEDMNYEYIACGDVMVLPYSRISASGVQSDAITVHLPVIGSEIPEFKEIEKQWGVVKTTDVTDSLKLKKTIREVVKNPSKFKKNIKKYIKHNNKDVVARHTLRVYEEVLSK